MMTGVAEPLRSINRPSILSDLLVVLATNTDFLSS